MRTPRACPECTIDEDPAPWCDCRGDERCAGPCRKRAHSPESCTAGGRPNGDPSYDPACRFCDTDTHLCGGCGTHLYHGQGICSACRVEHGDPTSSTSEAWGPLRLRWRNVVPGDVILGRKSKPWMITHSDWSPDGRDVWAVVAAHADDVKGRTVDPDEQVTVLAPVAERAALLLVREQLGKVTVGGRTV